MNSSPLKKAKPINDREKPQQYKQKIEPCLLIQLVLIFSLWTTINVIYILLALPVSQHAD